MKIYPSPIPIKAQIVGPQFTFYFIFYMIMDINVWFSTHPVIQNYRFSLVVMDYKNDLASNHLKKSQISQICLYLTCLNGYVKVNKQSFNVCLINAKSFEVQASNIINMYVCKFLCILWTDFYMQTQTNLQ